MVWLALVSTKGCSFLWFPVHRLCSHSCLEKDAVKATNTVLNSSIQLSHPQKGHFWTIFIHTHPHNSTKHLNEWTTWGYCFRACTEIKWGTLTSVYSISESTECCDKTLQVFRINFWLNINCINYCSKMAYLCLKCKWKYVNMTKLLNVHVLSLLYCCPDFILSKMLSRCDTYFICIFEFLDHIKFCKVVLNIFKVKIKFSVHSAHFNFYLKWKGEKTKKIQQNI